MRKEDWGSINIEYVPYETDELYKKINTQEDKNYCTYELIWEMERQYIGNGRFYANESIEFNLRNARPFNHKHDDYIEFIRTHKNCTIRITSVNKTKKQVVAAEDILIKKYNPPLNKISGSSKYNDEYLNLDGNNTRIAA